MGGIRPRPRDTSVVSSTVDLDYEDAKMKIKDAQDMVQAADPYYSFCKKYPEEKRYQDLLLKAYEEKVEEIQEGNNIIELIRKATNIGQSVNITAMSYDFSTKFPGSSLTKNINFELKLMPGRIRVISELESKIDLAECQDELEIIESEDMSVYKETYKKYDENYRYIQELLVKANNELEDKHREKVENADIKLKNAKTLKEIKEIKSGFISNKCDSDIWDEYLAPIANTIIEVWMVNDEHLFDEGKYKMENAFAPDEVIGVFNDFKDKNPHSVFLVDMYSLKETKLAEIGIENAEMVEEVNIILDEFKERRLNEEYNKILEKVAGTRIDLLEEIIQNRKKNAILIQIRKGIESATTDDELILLRKKLNQIEAEDPDYFKPFTDDIIKKIELKSNQIASIKLKETCDNIYRKALEVVYSTKESDELERIEKQYYRIFDDKCADFDYKARFDVLVENQKDALQKDESRKKFERIKSEINEADNICVLDDKIDSIDIFAQVYPGSEYVSILKGELEENRLSLEKSYHLQLENLRKDIDSVWSAEEVKNLTSDFNEEYPCKNDIGDYETSRIEMINVATSTYESVKKRITEEKVVENLQTLEEDVDTFKKDYPDNLFVSELINQLEQKHKVLMIDVLNVKLSNLSQKVMKCQDINELNEIENEINEIENEYIQYDVGGIKELRNGLDQKKIQIVRDVDEKKMQKECYELLKLVEQSIYSASNESALDKIKKQYVDEIDTKCGQYKERFGALLENQHKALYNRAIITDFNALEIEINRAKDHCVLNKVENEAFKSFMQNYQSNQYVSKIKIQLEKRRSELEKTDFVSKDKIEAEINKMWQINELNNLVLNFRRDEPCNHYLDEIDAYAVSRINTINQIEKEYKLLNGKIAQTENIDDLTGLNNELGLFRRNYPENPFAAELDGKIKEKHDNLTKEELEQRSAELSNKIDNATTVNDLISIENQFNDIGKKYFPYGQDMVNKLRYALEQKRIQLISKDKEVLAQECDEILIEIEEQIGTLNSVKELDEIKVKYSSNFNNECIKNLEQFTILMESHYVRLRKEDVNLLFDTVMNKITNAKNLCVLNRIRNDELNEFLMTYKSNKESVARLRKIFDEKRTKLKKIDLSNYEVAKNDINSANAVEKVRDLINSFNKQFPCSDYQKKLELEGEKRIIGIKRKEDKLVKQLKQKKHPCDQSGPEIEKEIRSWVSQYEKAWETEDIEMLLSLGHTMNKETRKRISKIFEQTKMRDVIITIKSIKVDKDDCTAKVKYKQNEKFVDDRQGYLETPARIISKMLKNEGDGWIWVKK